MCALSPNTRPGTDEAPHRVDGAVGVGGTGRVCEIGRGRKRTHLLFILSASQTLSLCGRATRGHRIELRAFSKGKVGGREGMEEEGRRKK